MFEKNSSSNALLKNICVSLSLSYWMNYTFIIGWIKNNSTNFIKGQKILNNEGLMRLLAVAYKEIFSLGPLTIFIKGLYVQMEFFLQALKPLFPPIILLAVIYFFYFKKK